jgi:hypothetical protein
MPGREVESWAGESGSCAVAWVQHWPSRVGDVRYVHAEPGRLALFAGRPVLWTGAESADGRSVLEPSFWLDVRGDAVRDLDGRFTALRFDDAEQSMEVLTDALGAYAVYGSIVHDVHYVSNSAELVRSVRGSRDVALKSVAGLLGGGWPLGGDPMWTGVRRLRWGALHRLAAGAAPSSEELLPRREVVAMLGAGMDAERAAAHAIASARALADWPGRPDVVPITGGRDSRLILGAALRAGFDFETLTGGEPDAPDVVAGRALAEAAGVPWRLLEHDPHGSLASDWRRAAELLDLTASGTASLSDGAGFPFGPRPGPLELWHSGHAGEVARLYYGSGAGLDRDGLVDRLYRQFTGRRPGRSEILGTQGEAIVRGQIAAFVDEQLGYGAAPDDVPDLFYLWSRTGTWTGPTHGAVEWVRDTTSPLWSRRLLPDQLGLPTAERGREVFDLRLIEQLAPELIDVPFEHGRGWAGRESELRLRARRAATLAQKARGEAARRLRARRGGGAPDPFATTLAEIREVVIGQPDHPAWQVLDRPRVEQLLATDAATLDTLSRYYAWRLATIFSAPVR